MLFLLFWRATSHLSCKNPNGDDVDWWAMFKKPGSLDYFYRDGKTGLSAGPGNLGQKANNPFYQSIQAVYDRSTVAYLFLNDQAPTGDATPRYAHDKAVLLYDQDNAVYIEHSVPQFPPVAANGYSYPDSGKANGQSFLCLTLSHTDLDRITDMMLVEIPYVYDSSVPAQRQEVQGVLDIIDEKWRDNEATGQVSVSAGSAAITQFVKSRKWGKDSYKDLLVNALGADGYSETWQNGSGGVLSSDCSGSHSIYNIQKVKFAGDEWTSTKDHSKWAVIGDHVCIGGVNRVASQEQRGGQHFCIKHGDFAAEMRNAVSEYEKC